ncbi:MAG TPA: class III poly(R)-hydroxyalkanoic acid synthase subunit PhaC [Candidatus Thermoplasmatota archaeon]|nr:class III poly(R)-hydroxyalkanoic acid synthase subunit PhaC [Candidatus Thermoplasmatota archaeon]
MDAVTAQQAFLKGLATQSETWSKRLSGMAKFLQDPPQVEVGATPHDVVYTENKLRLLRYRPRKENRHATPVLVVYALVNRPYILDLQPDRSVVGRLVDAGFDVYLIDWGTPSPLDQWLTLDDYVNRYIDNCVDVVREESGSDQVTLLGYCMGGAMSVMYSALHAEKVRNLIVMAAPLVHDEKVSDASLLNRWAQPEYFDVDRVVAAYGNAPGEFLDGGFQSMKPVENLFSKYVGFTRSVTNDDFVENFLRMETWSRDTIPVAGEAYRQFIRDLYQENKLAKGTLVLGGERVDLANLKMPMLLLTGQYDHLVPYQSTAGLLEATGSTDRDCIVVPTGHIGLSVSSRAHKELWPKVCGWLAERSGEAGGAAPSSS